MNMKMTGNCKLQHWLLCPAPSNYNGKDLKKSIRVSYNYQIPKSKPRTLCCSSSSASSRFSYTPQIFKEFDESLLQSFDKSTFLKNFLSHCIQLIRDHFARHLLHVSVVLLDEDQQLKQEFDELVLKASNETDLQVQANIVLDEVVPLLLENADRWVSSRFMVCSNEKEAFLKLLEYEQMCTDKHYLSSGEGTTDLDASGIEPSTANTVRCTEVSMDISILGVTEDNFREIHRREDFKVLLQHLMSVGGVIKASPVCFSVMVFKEKAKVLESYSHATT